MGIKYKKRYRAAVILCILAMALAGCTKEDAQEVQTGQTTTEAEGNGAEEAKCRIFVGIEAHIKEIHSGEVLIVSESDAYPGAFTVMVSEDVCNIEEFAGGDYIRVVMECPQEEQESTLYRAVEFYKTDRTEMEHDVFLTGAPELQLTDILSSLMAETTITAENYSWNYEEEDGMESVTACGPHPLDAGVEHTVIKIPDYQGTNGIVYYRCAAVIAPERQTISVWDSADAGNTEAERIAELTYYYKNWMLPLEAGRIYELSAEWTKDRGFYGTASYVFVTE